MKLKKLEIKGIEFNIVEYKRVEQTYSQHLPNGAGALRP